MSEFKGGSSLTDMEVDEIFDCAFVSVSKKIASLNLKRESNGDLRRDNSYTGSVYTKGKFNSLVVCEISSDVYEHIIYVMNGGTPASDDEKLLYINEYINIVCGCALSNISNKIGGASRLTVPVFLKKGETIGEEDRKSKNLVLYYETDIGVIRVSVYY